MLNSLGYYLLGLNKTKWINKWFKREFKTAH